MQWVQWWKAVARVLRGSSWPAAAAGLGAVQQVWPPGKASAGLQRCVRGCPFLWLAKGRGTSGSNGGPARSWAGIGVMPPGGHGDARLYLRAVWWSFFCRQAKSCTSLWHYMCVLRVLRLPALQEEAEKLISEARAAAAKKIQEAKAATSAECAKELAAAKAVRGEGGGGQQGGAGVGDWEGARTGLCGRHLGRQSV